jgi:hypothetical protein
MECSIAFVVHGDAQARLAADIVGRIFGGEIDAERLVTAARATPLASPLLLDLVEGGLHAFVSAHSYTPIRASDGGRPEFSPAHCLGATPDAPSPFTDAARADAVCSDAVSMLVAGALPPDSGALLRRCGLSVAIVNAAFAPASAEALVRVTARGPVLAILFGDALDGPTPVSALFRRLRPAARCIGGDQWLREVFADAAAVAAAGRDEGAHAVLPLPALALAHALSLPALRPGFRELADVAALQAAGEVAKWVFAQRLAARLRRGDAALKAVLGIVQRNHSAEGVAALLAAPWAEAALLRAGEPVV